MLNSTNKHILVVSQYYYPEQFRINDICAEWVKRGYKVTVLTGIPNYPHGNFFQGYGLFTKRKETIDGVNIKRIPIIPRGKSAVTLVLNYLSFVISGLFWFLFTNQMADIVFIYEVSPMTQALPGIWFAQRRRIPCFLYVQDLWPENVEIVAKVKNKHILKMLARMVDYIYQHCTKIFTTSDSFSEAIFHRNVPLEKIICWPQYAEDYYRSEQRKDVCEIPNDDAFNITFTGNIGHAQGLDILPRAALILKEHRKNVRFNIIGDGRYKNTLVSLVNHYQVTEMFNFIDRQPASRVPELLAASDAALICLSTSPLFMMTIPAKLQSYLACGIPIIAAVGGETQRIIKDANAGLSCPAGDATMLANIIIELAEKTPGELSQLSKAALNYSQLHFDKGKLLDRMDEYILQYQ